MPRNTEVTIDPEAIAHNLGQVQRWVGDAKVMAVVKADAYGHRLDLCVPALARADLLAVATLEEARAIRRLGISQSIVLLEGVSHKSDLPVVADLELELTVHHEFQVQALEAFGRSPAKRIWIKINTGMNRLGIRPEQAREVYERLSALADLEAVAWISHFSSAESDPKRTEAQQALFEQTLAGLPGERCLANSAAILSGSGTHLDWVRAGIVLYGISPMANSTSAELGLLPAMKVEAELISVYPIASGEQVGYGGRFVAKEPMVVGVASIGYGDGYPRAMQDGAPVLVQGQRCRLIGRVSMDMITVDVTGLTNPKVGDVVTLWGGGLAVEEVAKWADTIPYELVCRMTRRVRYNIAS